MIDNRPRVFAALFTLSWGATGITYCLFRTLSFCLVPPIVPLSILLVCFPLGAIIATRRYAKGIDGITRVIKHIFIICIGTFLLIRAISVGFLFILDTRFGSAFFIELGDIDATSLPFSILLFISAVPFFLWYGAMEFLAFQFGAAKGRSFSHSYAAFLFGSGVSLAVLSLFFEHLGIPACVAASLAGLALCPPVLGHDRGRRFCVAAALLVCLSTAFALGQVRLFPRGLPAKVAELQHGIKIPILFEGWSKYAYLTLVEEEDDDRSREVGAFSDMARFWGHSKNFDVGTLPFLLAHPEERALILGAGSGRQIIQAKELGLKDVTAVEIDPVVVEQLSGPLAANVQWGYRLADEVIVGEGRSFVRDSSQRYGVIHLSDIGITAFALQTLITPSDMIFTREALKDYVEKLEPEGILAYLASEWADPHNWKLRRILGTMRHLGQEYYAFKDGDYILAMGAENLCKRDVSAQLAKLVDHRLYPGQGNPTRLYTSCNPAHVAPEPPDGFYGTDDMPATGLHDQIRLPTIRSWFAIVLGTGLALLSLILLLLVLRAPRGNRSTLLIRSSAATMVGVNFVLIENLVIYRLTREFFDNVTAVFAGSILCLALFGIGSMTIRNIRGLWPAATALGGAALLCYGLSSETTVAHVAGWIGLCCTMIPAGTFFPLMFTSSSRFRLTIYAMDAVGALIGGVVALAVPLVMTFSTFALVALVSFAGTAALVILSRRN